jgi:integrase
MNNLINNSDVRPNANALVPATAFSSITGSAGIEAVIAKAKFYVVASSAFSSRKAMASDFRHFETWCRPHGLASMPATPETVALYLADNAEVLAVSTLERRLISITAAHRAAQVPGLSPASTRHMAVGSVMRGIRRAKGVAPLNRKAPMLNAEIRLLAATFGRGKDLRNTRDAAITLVGYSGAFRRSEVAGITLSSIEWVDAGAVLHVGRSKRDQEGVGRKVAIPFGAWPATCPIRALRRWIDESGLAGSDGPLFRAISQRGLLSAEAMNPASVSYILKRGLRRAGLDDAAYSAHSLRSGFCTQAHFGGASDAEIMGQTSHRSRKSLAPYIRPSFGQNAAAKLGL